MGFAVDNNYPDSSHRYVMAGMAVSLAMLASLNQTSHNKDIVGDFVGSLSSATQIVPSHDHKRGQSFAPPAHMYWHAVGPNARPQAQAVSEIKLVRHGFDVGTGGPAMPKAGTRAAKISASPQPNVKALTFSNLINTAGAVLVPQPKLKFANLHDWDKGGYGSPSGVKPEETKPPEPYYSVKRQAEEEPKREEKPLELAGALSEAKPEGPARPSFMAPQIASARSGSPQAPAPAGM